MGRAIDIVKVKAEIAAGKLAAIAENGNVLLKDMQSGEAVKIATLPQPSNEAPPCYQPDGDGCAYQCYDGDDEPIDKCKECPRCYSDKQRRKPSNEALDGWVSVEERLPENSECWETYIVTVNRSHWPTSSYDSCDAPYDETFVSTAKYDSKQKIWHLDWDEQLNALIDIENAPLNGDYVTHWMPLPEPPDRRPPEGEEGT